MPPLPDWFRSFALASLVSIVATYLVLLLLSRRKLKHSIELDPSFQPLSAPGRTVAFGVIAAVLVLLSASAAGKDLGPPTFIAAVVVLAIVLLSDRKALLAIRHIIVAAFETHGAIRNIRTLLHSLENWTPLTGALAASFGVALACNVANNLPVGLLTGAAIQGTHLVHSLRNALVIGVDLGPNLSATGSLATLLWLVALRREGENITAWTFLKSGLLVAPPALFLAIICAAWN